MFAPARLFVLATAAAVALPTLPSAATIVIENALNVNGNYSYAEVISPMDTIEFRFTALDDFMIDSFSVSGTGTDAEDDVRDIRFGFSEPATEPFTTVESSLDAAAGFGFLTGRTLAMGEMFSVFFTDGITNDVGLTLSFDTLPLAAIPLPATGLLLAPLLLAGGIAASRRRKAAASLTCP